MDREKKIDTKKIILSVIGTAGILALALIAPNALRMFKIFDKGQKKYDPKYYLNKRVQNMIKKGLLKELNQGNTTYIILTEKGKRELNKYLLKEQALKNKKWDGKWRVFIFDVWEKSRRKRDLLRQEIKEFGFIQLQKSVWIYPFECGEFIELLKLDLNFGKNVRYMVVEELDNDQALRKHFELKD